MIGNYIKGIDIKTGKPVAGFVLDKVLTEYTNQIPFVNKDAYLVLNQSNNDSIHLVDPGSLTFVQVNKK